MNSYQEEMQNVYNLLHQVHRADHVDQMTEFQAQYEYGKLIAAGIKYEPPKPKELNFKNLILYMDNDLNLVDKLRDYKCHVVYFFYNSAKELVYIGRTDQFKNRLAQHWDSDKEMKEVAYVELRIFDTKHEVMFYETQKIIELQPKWNKAGLSLSPSKQNLEPLGSVWFESNAEARKKVTAKHIDKIAEQMEVFYTPEWFARQSDQDLCDECNRILDLEFGIC